ncbi:UDP-N-acetylglucosamine 2-epimerase [Salinibacter ruber]|uniref:UDP-N-acetylglucosamine 2-epimerase n=1 Tax=Salinibacter ruber TaxID=146919 RepID=UPI0021698BE5|nr:UDP-N-acetylglucosamine 2-epimerase [Salinibacter ruber]MCS3638166.1 UDP-N-acetylglucosamine 2-epimerase (non-hydrolyzing)/GDP/UDP-N,N'-diacetylbacillosamine 2-epimerase (hydrolyzing) [Salinibacter ruber]
MATRRVCIVTGTRAEYGLLYWLMREVKEDPDLDLQIIATGMHLSPEFGLTYQEIEEDGFEIDEKVEMLTSSDTPVGIAKSMGLGTIGFADALHRLEPDVLVLLGDRYEVLAVAQAAMVARIPIAHIHGGEVTEGAVDDSIRHAVTKMAHVHFVATAPFKKRVIQLGERPGRVFNVGAPGLDYLRHLDLMDRDELESSLDFELGGPTFLITYHPATLQTRPPEESTDELLKALDQFPEARLIFTKANADADGRTINQRIERYVNEESHRAQLYSSLGQKRYLSALHHVDLVLGNSSSGLTEAPAVPVPTVNLGARQDGRPRAESVIDCREQTDEIVESIRSALSDSFRERLENVTSPYGDGRATPRICRHLKEITLEGLTTKSFYDLNVGEPSAASEQEQCK